MNKNKIGLCIIFIIIALVLNSCATVDEYRPKEKGLGNLIVAAIVAVGAVLVADAAFK